MSNGDMWPEIEPPKEEFKEIRYRGKPFIPDVGDKVDTMYYQHIYSTNFEGTVKRHMCIQWGHFCWKQFRERPLDIFKYHSIH